MKASAQTDNLLSLAKTKKEADEVINSIENLSPYLFNKKIKLDKKLNKFFTLEQKDKLIEFIKEKGIDLEDAIKVQEFFSQLKSKLEQLPIITLTLAFDPKPQTIANISGWLMLNSKNPILIDYSIDPKLMGGCILVYKGFYIDASLRKKLSESSI